MSRVEGGPNPGLKHGRRPVDGCMDGQGLEGRVAQVRRRPLGGLVLEIGEDAGWGAEGTADAGLERRRGRGGRGRGRFRRLRLEGHVAHGRGQGIRSGSRPGELVHLVRVVRVNPFLVFVIDGLVTVDAYDGCEDSTWSLLSCNPDLRGDGRKTKRGGQL